MTQLIDDEGEFTDYGKLSFYVGLFAGTADQYLGRDHFASLCRASAWNLTWEKLEDWKREAMNMGIPPKMFDELPPEIRIKDADSS
jgi:hypothetical protein